MAKSRMANVACRPYSPLAIPHFALYIPLARPRPGFWRFARDPKKAKTMTERSSAGLDERRRRLLFRAWRRGVREMDLIVGRFADVYIDQFDEVALDDFERLIELPNADLYAWIVGHEAVPANHDTVVLRQLIAFHNRAEAKPKPKPGPKPRAKP
jgi:antitoxin CptB